MGPGRDREGAAEPGPRSSNPVGVWRSDGRYRTAAEACRQAAESRRADHYRPHWRGSGTGARRRGASGHARRAAPGHAGRLGGVLGLPAGRSGDAGRPPGRGQAVQLVRRAGACAARLPPPPAGDQAERRAGPEPAVRRVEDDGRRDPAARGPLRPLADRPAAAGSRAGRGRALAGGVEPFVGGGP